MELLNKAKSYISYITELSYVNHYEWHIALRLRGEKSLYQGNGDGFKPVPNNWRYWRADPFLFRYQGRDYLFAEMYDRWKQKGVIGVCRIRKGKCGRFRKCLELPWHLSYPCVIEDEKGIHMVPECSASGELWMFRCRRFPMKWEKECCIAKEPVADATPFTTGQGRMWFSTRFTEEGICKNDNLSVRSEGEFDDTFKRVVPFDTAARSAGHFIPDGNRWLRPTQNCTNTYGGNLEFRQVDEISRSSYREHAVLRVYAPGTETIDDGIRVNCMPVIGTRYDGIHTYNINENYEVIDLKYKGARSIISLIRNLRDRYTVKREN